MFLVVQALLVHSSFPSGAQDTRVQYGICPSDSQLSLIGKQMVSRVPHVMH